MSKHHILITGGAGFIGTHLCRTLVEHGHSVRVLDRADPKTPVAGVEYQKGDVRDPQALLKAIQGVSAVYHFAATVSVALCQEQPEDSYSNNLLATVSVLEAIKRESARQGRKLRLVFAGSSAVYGNTGKENVAISEGDEAGSEPQGYYAAQKLGSEHAIRVFHQITGIPAVIFRFFNVYGPGQDPSSPYSGVISIFTKRLNEGQPLRLNGNGTPTRDFVSVHDIARANRLALDAPEAFCDGRPINLGTGHSITIRTLAEEMKKASDRNSPLEDAPWREGDVAHSRANIGRAKEILGWQSQVTLQEGLRELLR